MGCDFDRLRPHCLRGITLGLIRQAQKDARAAMFSAGLFWVTGRQIFRLDPPGFRAIRKYVSAPTGQVSGCR